MEKNKKKPFQYFTDIEKFTRWYIRNVLKVKLPVKGYLKRHSERLEVLMQEENARRKQMLINIGSFSKDRWTELGTSNLEAIYNSDELTEKRINNLREAAQDPKGFHKTKAWENAQDTWTDPKRIEAVKIASAEIVTCPHCNKSGGRSAMNGWHFDYCTSNPNRKFRKGKQKGIIKSKVNKPKKTFDYDQVYNLLPIEFKMSDARDIVASFGKSEQCANNYIKTSGKFEKVSHGIWRKIEPNC